MSALRLTLAALGIPLLGTFGWTVYISRNVRSVITTDPLLVSSYCKEAVRRTKQEGVPCLICAFEVPVVVQTASIRRKLEQEATERSLYALHALLSSFFMRVEVTTTALTSSLRLSDVYACWKSTSSSVLAEERRDHVNGLNMQYGKWELHPKQEMNQSECDTEAVLKYKSETIAVSLEPNVEGTRLAVLRLCYIVQPFDMFEKNSTAERIALWGTEKYAKLLTAQAAHALERLETR